MNIRICHRTLMECPHPSMCAPFQGCGVNAPEKHYGEFGGRRIEIPPPPPMPPVKPPRQDVNLVDELGRMIVDIAAGTVEDRDVMGLLIRVRDALRDQK